MNIRRHFTNTSVELACALLAMLYLVACNQSQPPTPAPSAPVTSEKVFVEFRGPWAFVVDPKDANSVLAIAPKAKGHRDLDVQASNETLLDAGVYNLSLPAHSGPAAATADPGIAQAKIDAQSLQRALDKKSARYVIRLPKPEEYVVAKRHRSRLGAQYPPDASTEKEYATATSLRYNVSSLSGFSLAGTPDSGTFNPLLLQVETPTIRFIIAPDQENDPHDKCDTHSRQSFHDLTTLLGLTLYVDFPDNPDDCHKSDPQNVHPAKAERGWSSPLERVAALWGGSLADVQTADVAGGGVTPVGPWFLIRGDKAEQFEQRLLAAVYFFDHDGGDCASPHIILNPTS